MKRYLLTLVLLAGLFLSACTAAQTYPAPQPLSLYADYEASASSTVAIAVSATGTSHIVRTQCDTATGTICRLIYQSIRAGNVINSHTWWPPADTTYRNPDIALVGELAYVVFQYCLIDSSLCKPLFVRPPINTDLYYLDSEYLTRDVPLVVSRGGMVYAVYETPIPATGSALRFCNFSNFECNWVSPHPADDPNQRTAATAAVDGDGFLHVAYLLKETGQQTVFYANNTGAWLEDMTGALNYHLSRGTPAISPDEFAKPALAVQSDNFYVHLAVAKRIASGSDGLTVYYSLPADPDAGSSCSINLAADKQWQIIGDPSITTWTPPATNQSAEIAFAAITTEHLGQTDIYTARCTPFVSPAAPTHLYITSLNSGDYDVDPIISVTGGWPVVGWHIYNSSVGYWDDVYVYSFSGQIIHRADWNGGRSLDMAGNGDYVAGVWNETQADGRLATWFAYNAHMLWLPLVKK